MPEPRIVQNAEQAPGVCVISGDNDGPFLDTGRNLRRYGRVYVSLKHAGPLLRRAGWLTDAETEKLREEVEALREQVSDLSTLEEEYRDLVNAVLPFLPTPEPVERQVVKYETRDITDEDISAFLRRNPRFLEKFVPAEPGSVEEWNALYRPRRPAPAPDVPAAPAAASESAADESAGSAELEVDGMTINLDEVLAQNVQTIVEYAEGHPELQRALAEREAETRPKGDPRRTVLRLAEAAA